MSKLSFTTPFRDAWAAWRQDSTLLLPLAGLTMFLPQLAVYLLVPRLVLPMEEGAASDPAAQQAMVTAMSEWLSQYGGWYLLAPLCGLFGALTVMVLYLAPTRPTLGGALGRASALFLRYLLASILLGFAAAPVLGFGLVSPVLVFFLMPLAFYLLGRTMLTGPAIVSAAPIGAIAAIQRSWALTRGNGWMLGATYAAPMFVTQIVVSALLGFDTLGGGNPVIGAIVDGLAALTGAASALTLALVEVALYRRFANTGT